MHISSNTLTLLRRVGGVAAVATLTAASALPAAAQYTATVDVGTRYQTFEGWGTSLAWWANVVGGYPSAYRDDYMSKFFDPVNGLGLNIVRYNIGGGENPAYLPPNNAYLQYRARVPGFLSSPTASYDWTQDANQRLVLQQAIQQGVTISEAFSNSPPYWMTNSGSVSGASGGGNNLNTSYVSAFADYLTTVVQHYHDAWGITFRTLEAFNEPASGYWHFGGNQEGCGFDPSYENYVAKAVGASLANKSMGYTTLSASDETSIDQAITTLATMDSTSLAYMSQINTHTYSGSKRAELASAVAATGKRLSMSEIGNGDGTGLSTAAGILLDLNVMRAKSWVYWQAVDSASGWGFLNNALDGSTNYGYQVNEKYYAFANFSRFIRPGYQIVSMSDSNSVAAYDGRGTVVIVTVSQSNTDQAVTYALNNFGTGPWQIAQYRTSGTENLASLPSFGVTGTSFTKVIPANSVTTFVVTNGQSGPFVPGKTYSITNANSGLSLEVPGASNTAGQVLDQAATSNAANQQWTATAAGANWVLTNVNSGQAIDVSGPATGAPAVQASVTHHPTQIWTIAPTGDGSYKLVNSATGLDLEVANASTAPGATIDQGADSGASSQHWNITQVQRPGQPTDTQLALTGYQATVASPTAEQLGATITGSGAPFTGSVTFYDGSSAIGSVTGWDSTNVAKLSASLPPGTHYISAVYSGDATHNPSSTTAVPVVVTGQSPSLFTAGKPYILINVKSGLLLEVPGGSRTAGASLDQYLSNNGTNQRWAPTASGTNWVWTNVNSGLAVDVASSTAGASATQNTASGSATQTWTTVAVGDGSYKLVNASTGYDLEVSGASNSNGATVDQWYDNGGANQHWIIAQVPDGFVQGRSYVMLGVKSGLVIDVPNASTAAGTGLIQYTSNNGTNQRWSPTASGSNWIWKNVNSGLAMDPSSSAAGSSVTQNTVNGGATQAWTATAIGDGSFKLVNASTGYNLEISGASTSNGAAIDQWYENNGANQHWIIAQLAAAAATPTIAWAVPADITYGTALSATQQNATATVNGASVPGSFTYSSPIGTILSGGSHLLTVTFTPNDGAAYTTAAGSVTLQVDPAASTTVLSAPASVAYGAAASLTATVSSTAPSSLTGSVQFFDGTTSLGTAAVSNGAATLSTSSLAAGTHTISAVYSGDGNYQTSGSAASAVTVGNVQLVATTTLTKLGDGSYQARMTVQNQGTITAPNVTVTSLTVGSVNATPTPATVGDLPAGSTASLTLSVPGSVGTSGSAVAERFTGTYTGGSFGGSQRAKLP